MKSPASAFRTYLATCCIVAAAGCGNSTGPAIAVGLTLHSVDGIVIPVQLRTPGGKLVSLATGRLQGTSWGHACGAAFSLADGPITAIDVPDCKLIPGEDRKVTLTFTDSRFPAGAHEYRFIPQ